MRWINRLGTAMILLAVIAGPPLAVTAWLLHQPSRWPTVGQVQAWLDRPLTAGAIVAGCVAVAVLAWLLLVYHLMREAGRAIRRRWRRRRMALPSPAQVTASSMAGVAALTLPGLVSTDRPPPPTALTTPGQPTDPVTPDPAAEAAAGIDLPGGGWIPTSAALAVSTAASLIWLRRRQHYQPKPPHPDRHTRDQDLQPLPITAQAITATPPADHHGGVPPTMFDSLPDGVIHLDGSGAIFAARGILVTAALTAALGHPARLLYLSRTDLARLLPDIDPDDLAEAGIHLDDTDGPPPGDHHHHHQPGRPTLQAEPGPSTTPHTTIRLGSDPDATIHWHVTRDGTTTGTGVTTPHRLCILDQPATADLLTLVRQTLGHSTSSSPPPPPGTTTAEPDTATPPSGTTAPAHLALIGGCDLTVAGTPVRLRRSAGLQILAYLALHPAGATKTDLIHACWPGQPPAAIGQRLHTTLTDLRRHLRPLIGADPILRHGDHYQLNQSAIDTDLRAWHTAVHAAANGASAEQRLDASHTIIDLYRGELAAGHHWPWLAPAREALRRDALDAYTAAADDAPPAHAAALLQQARTIDPYNKHMRHHAAHTLRQNDDNTG